MIHVKGVIKKFGPVAAVDGVSFHIDEGESIALWGSNGAGKTTLIRCLLGVLRFRGRIVVGDENVKRRGKMARRLIGYVPQELAFHDDTRLGAAMIFFAKLRRVDPARCVELLEQVGLTGHERKRVRDLSGGMKQRLALAVAMLADPPIIILDEPTSNLDAVGRSEVFEMLQVLKRKGKTILFASHRPDEVIGLADRLLVMEKGRLVRDTTPASQWPAAGAVQTMRLVVAGEREESAATLLRDAGHIVHLNGRGLCVLAPHDKKALPIRLLAQAGVDIHDFEILEDFNNEEGAR